MRNVFLLAYAAASVLSAFSATFEIGENDFLLDGKPFVVRCGLVRAVAAEGFETGWPFIFPPRSGLIRGIIVHVVLVVLQFNCRT